MPAKRRVPKDRNFNVTPTILAAFKAGNEVALHEACGLAPWEPSPLRHDLGVNTYPPGSAWAVSTPKVVEMRREILKALSARRKG